WNPAAAGTIQVADGATVGLGGLLTTDQFMALPSLPGIRIHPALDTVILDGWLDNKPADNPVTHGVLTGSVTMSGGLISGGTIAGALHLVYFGGPLSLAFSFIDSVTNNGTIAVGTFFTLEGNVVNNATLTSSAGISFLSGGSFINNGTISASSGGYASA